MSRVIESMNNALNIADIIDLNGLVKNNERRC